MKFFLRVLCAFAVITLLGCRSLGPLPVLMQTELGQPVTKTEPQRTADRKNVPTGVKPKDIVAHVKTKSGAETWVDKKGYVYQNEQAKEENEKPPDRPKRPWYFWPAWILLGLSIVAGIITLMYLRGLLAPVIRFLKPVSKIFKRS